MHDATEGGVLGAVWEIAECSGVGVEVYLDKIPIKKETKDICNYYNISPYQLISSGCMIITTYDGNRLVEQLKMSGLKHILLEKLLKKTEFAFKTMKFCP